MSALVNSYEFANPISFDAVFTTGFAAFSKLSLGSAGATVVIKIDSSLITHGGSTCRLDLRGDSSSGSQMINSIWVGIPDPIGLHLWDFEAANPAPVQVTFGGNTTLNLGVSDIGSDDIAFDPQAGPSFLVAFDIANAVSFNAMRVAVSGLPSGKLTTYYKTGVTQAGTAVKASSYSNKSSSTLNLIGIVAG